MDALERRGLVLFVHWGLDFENSRQSFLDCTHRAYRQWVRSAQGEHAQEAIRTARRVAPEGFIPFVTALADYMPIYGEWLTVARAQGVIAA